MIFLKKYFFNQSKMDPTPYHYYYFTTIKLTYKGVNFWPKTKYIYKFLFSLPT